MSRLRFNGLRTTLGAALSDTDTTVTFEGPLTHNGGQPVPSVGGGDRLPLSLIGPDGLVEIVHLTAYVGGEATGTVERAQEGTTAVAHGAGGKVVHSATAEDLTGVVTSETTTRIVVTDDINYDPAPGELVLIQPPAEQVGVYACFEPVYIPSSVSPNLPLAVPVGVRDGDYLLAVFGHSYPLSALAGFTSLGSQEVSGQTVTVIRRLTFAGKVADAADGGQVLTFSQATAGRMSGTIIVIRAAEGDPIPVGSPVFNTATTGNDVAIPSVTVSGAQYAIAAGTKVSAATADDTFDTVTVTPPWEFLVANSRPGGSDAALRFWVCGTNQQGTTPSGTFTDLNYSNAKVAGVLVLGV